MKPQIDDLVTASQRNEPGLRRMQRGGASLGWYRGEQSRTHEIYKLLMRWGNVRVAARLLQHYNMGKKGQIPG